MDAEALMICIVSIERRRLAQATRVLEQFGIKRFRHSRSLPRPNRARESRQPWRHPARVQRPQEEARTRLSSSRERHGLRRQELAQMTEAAHLRRQALRLPSGDAAFHEESFRVPEIRSSCSSSVSTSSTGQPASTIPPLARHSLRQPAAPAATVTTAQTQAPSSERGPSRVTRIWPFG